MRFLLFLWLLLLSMLSVLSYTDHSFASGQCLEDQRALLLQLKYNISFSTLPSAISKLTSWVLKTDCCSWEGITCDREGHVIGLDLSNKFISGVAQWSSLLELKFLISLNLSYNSFNSTPIPSGLDRLANLKYLNLSNSGFGGQVPIDVSRMKRLVLLDLSTLYAAPLRLENPDLITLVRDLSELRELYLDGVDISMHGIEWSQAISSALPNLQVLSLSNCKLSGPLHPSLLKLRSLSKLRLDQNNISAQIPDFIGNFSNLSYIYLSDCGLRGKFPGQIFKLPLLRSLDVSANRFLQGFLPDFPLNSVLQNIVLSDTNFSGKLPRSIGNLRLLWKLEFQSCDFSGSIPSSMSKLTKLEYLDLSLNKFTGMVPNFGSSVNLTYINLGQNQLRGVISSSHWGKHLKLVNLNLRNNSLKGTIPSSLLTLPSLQKLDLSQNQFTGQLSDFPNHFPLILESLDLSNNMLEGPIPSSIYEISSLRILALSSNNWNETVQLDKFQNLRNLSSLYLSGIDLWINTSVANTWSFPQFSTLSLVSCNLRTFPEFLRNQSSLSYLDLSYNQIRGKIPNWIENFDDLTYLDLSFNLLEYPNQVLNGSRFQQLLYLDLHSNLLQGSIPILPPMAAFLDYSHNNLTSIIPKDIGSYLKISLFFSLSHNRFSGGIPSSLCNVNYLQVLDLSNNDLSGHIPQCLSGLGNLVVFNLRNNQFHGVISNTFSRECSLRTLDLNGNKIEGEVPNSLATCRDLEVLDMGNNNIYGMFPSWLGESSKLRILILGSNKLHGPIKYPKGKNTFPLLHIIDLSSNKFTGNLPSELFKRWKAMMINANNSQPEYEQQISKYTFLKLSRKSYHDVVTIANKGQKMELVKIYTIFASIDLSNNQFHGKIPSVIGNLISLHTLNLSHNALTGSIPSSLGNLKALESLDLSRNKLHDGIPTELADITFLSVLNLSFNQLVGRIPQNRQFQTFQEDAFRGNKGLCGPPMSKSCNISNTQTTTTTSRSKPCKFSLFKNCPEDGKFNWQLISITLGYGVGIGISFCLVLLWRPWDHLCKRILKIV